MKKGLTLIELIVAMTIFIVVTTLAIGGFIAVIRSRMVVGNMKDSQQQIRIIGETINRYAKEAEYVRIPADGNSLEMFFDMGGSTYTGSKIQLITGGSSNDLQLFTCPTGSIDLTTRTCSAWGTGTTILGSKVQIGSSPIFSLSSMSFNVLDYTLSITSGGAGTTNSTMTLNNSVLLEGLK